MGAERPALHVEGGPLCTPGLDTAGAWGSSDLGSERVGLCNLRGRLQVYCRMSLAQDRKGHPGAGSGSGVTHPLLLEIPT